MFNRRSFKLAMVLATLVWVGTLYASTEGSPKIPLNFQSWRLANSMLVSKEPDRSGIIAGVHLIYVNPIGFRRLKRDDSTPYPEGTVFVDDVRGFTVVDNAYHEGARKAITVMIKDSKKYASTGGWGFQAYAGGDASKPIVNDPVKQCFECHTAQKANNYVFSTYVQ
jgi:hypothetical protein